MCTNIDRIATEIEKKRLKKISKGHAWKIVRIDGEEWVAPYNYSVYKKVGTNVAGGCLDTSWGEIHGGAFHFFLTRKLARSVVKAQVKSNKTVYLIERKYKVVKVIFNAKDFVCIGRQRAIDKRVWNLPQGNESVCAKAFKFAEK